MPARARLTDWLAGLSVAEAKPLKARLAAHPTVSTLLESLAENSPYLWELASREPQRLLRLLDCDPERHLADLLAEHYGIAKSRVTLVRGATTRLKQFEIGN